MNAEKKICKGGCVRKKKYQALIRQSAIPGGKSGSYFLPFTATIIFSTIL